MTSICDKCVHGRGVCSVAVDLGMISTKDSRDIVACFRYELDPAVEVERDMTQALQKLMKQGRIKTGCIVRRESSLVAITDPPLPDGEILRVMKLKPES